MRTWVVTLNKGVSVEAFADKHPRLTRAVVVKLTKRIFKVEADEALVYILRHHPDVTAVEKDHTGKAVEEDVFIPTDSLFRQQWSLFATHVPDAWEDGYTGKRQSIAIIDSGLDGTHPEFGGNGDNRINAMLGDAALLSYYEPVMRRIRRGNHPKILPGWNFIDDNDNTFDFHRHGTACAGVAVAMGNGLGIVGVAPDAKIAPYKVLGQDSRGSLSNVVAAIGKIVETDIRIISISLVFRYTSAALKAVVEDANEDGVLVIAASGNSNSRRNYYPAAAEYTVSVGGTDRGHRLWVHAANEGSTWPCDIVAPAGPQPVALKWRGRYTKNMGTSLAAPHVAGIAALCLEARPDLSVESLKTVLFKSCRVGSSREIDEKWGHGEVDAARAVKFALLEDRPDERPNWATMKELLRGVTEDVESLSHLVDKYASSEL